MSRLALVWRLARRNALLTRGQAALIVTLIALPIVGFSGSMLVFQSLKATPSEQLTALMGHTASKLTPVSVPDPTLRQHPLGSAQWDVARGANGNPAHEQPGEVFVEPQTALPAGTRVLRLADGMAEVDSATGVADLPVTLGPSWDPSLVGRFRITEGTAPSNGNEIMVSRPTLARLGVAIGDTVHVRNPIDREYTVTGVLADTRGPDSVQELFLPDGAFDGTSAKPLPTAYSYYLPSLDLSPSQTKVLNHAGFVAISRSSVARYGQLRSWIDTSHFGILYLLFGVGVMFGVFEVALLAGSAFFIGARARQRVLAIVASTGATRRTLVGVVTASGAGLGLLSGILGVVAGIGAGSLWIALTSNGSAMFYPGYHLNWLAHGLIVLFAGVLGYAAALVPALSVSRVDVVAALRGATRPRAQRLRRPIVGAIVVITGATITVGAGILTAGLALGWFDGPPGNPSFIQLHEGRVSALLAYTLTGGVIITQLGLILAAGVVLRIVNLALGRVGTATKLASRDLSRNRGRAVPAIASIMTTSFLAVLVVGMGASENAETAAAYQWQLNPDQALVSVAGGNTIFNQNAAALTSVLSRSLPVRGAATQIAGAPIPDWSEDTSQDTALYAAPEPVKSAICPDRGPQGQVTWNPTSTDWRCSDTWGNYTGVANGEPTIVVGDTSVLAAILGHKPSTEAAAALAGGGAVALHRAFTSDGATTVGWYTATERQSGLPTAKTLERPTRSVSLPSVLESTPQPLPYGIVISPSTAEKLGIAALKQGILVQLSRVPTQSEQDALQAAMEVVNAQHPTSQESSGITYFDALVETGPGDASAPWMWGALAASSLIAIASAVVALTLARQDGARDDAVLNAVGAAPRTRRRVAFWQGAIIVGAGTLLGTATASLAVYASEGIGPGKVFDMPWLNVALGTIGLTLVVALGAWLSAGRSRASGAQRSAL